MPEKTDPQNLPLREELKATTLAIIIKTWGKLVLPLMTECWIKSKF